MLLRLQKNQKPKVRITNSDSRYTILRTDMTTYHKQKKSNQTTLAGEKPALQTARHKASGTQRFELSSIHKS